MPEISHSAPSSPAALRQLQEDLAKIFTDPRGPRWLHQNNQIDLSSVSDGTTASPLERVSVYADAYFLRLKEILSNDFEVSKKLMGSDLFHELVVDYHQAHPPSSPNAAWVGKYFAAYISSISRWNEIVGLESMAALEWASNEVVFEKWIDEVASAQLGSMTADALSASTFATDASVRFVRCEDLIEDLWLERDTLEELAVKASGTNAEKPWILVRRGNGGGIKFLRFSAGEKILWDEISQAQTLAEVCVKIEDSEEACASLAQLGLWSQIGLIKKIGKSSSSENGED
ncbi:MAG: DNA-binding domain-containing protein [Bdellovibrionota bacterium]